MEEYQITVLGEWSHNFKVKAKSKKEAQEKVDKLMYRKLRRLWKVIDTAEPVTEYDRLE